MELVTGRAGTPHITPQMDAFFHRGITGLENCVLDIGEKFGATIVSATQIDIGSGVGLLQGRIFEILPNLKESVTIQNGTQGELRHDVIYVEIEQHSDGTQTVALKVEQGIPYTETPNITSISSGVLDDGDLTAAMPLYRVDIEGITISGITPLFEQLKTLDNTHPAGSVLITSENVNPGTYLGGTWELVDKRLKNAFYESSSIPGLIAIKGNATAASSIVQVEGNRIDLRCNATLKNNFLEVDAEVLSIDFEKIGVTRLAYTDRAVGGAAGEGKIVIGMLAYDTGVVTLTSAVTQGGSAITAGTEVWINFKGVVKAEYMIDEYCDKFYWKRTGIKGTASGSGSIVTPDPIA